MLSQQVADSPAPFLGQLSRVRSRYEAVRRMLGKIPRLKQNARVGRFGGAWRHENRQPIRLAARDLFKLRQQQTMMRGRLKARVPTPIN